MMRWKSTGIWTYNRPSWPENRELSTPYIHTLQTSKASVCTGTINSAFFFGHATKMDKPVRIKKNLEQTKKIFRNFKGWKQTYNYYFQWSFENWPLLIHRVFVWSVVSSKKKKTGLKTPVAIFRIPLKILKG